MAVAKNQSSIAMDHQYIEDQRVAERFLDRTLPPEERAAFEKHFVDCVECLDRLALAEIFRAQPPRHREGAMPSGPIGTPAPVPQFEVFETESGDRGKDQVENNGVPDKRVLDNQVQENRAQSNRVQSNRVQGNQVEENRVPENRVKDNPLQENRLQENRVTIRAKFSTLEFVAIAVAAAILFVSVPSAYFIWQLAEERRADLGPSAALFAPERGRETIIHLGRASYPVVFLVDLGDAGAGTQRVTLVARGRTVWNGGALLAINGAAPGIAIPSHDLPSGPSILRVESKKENEDWQSVAEFPLNVIR